MSSDKDDWIEWKHHVLNELSRIDKHMELAHSEHTKIRVEIARLKVKSGIWGLMGALIPIVIGLAIELAVRFK